MIGLLIADWFINTALVRNMHGQATLELGGRVQGPPVLHHKNPSSSTRGAIDAHPKDAGDLPRQRCRS